MKSNLRTIRIFKVDGTYQDLIINQAKKVLAEIEEWLPKEMSLNWVSLGRKVELGCDIGFYIPESEEVPSAPPSERVVVLKKASVTLFEVVEADYTGFDKIVISYLDADLPEEPRGVVSIEIGEEAFVEEEE